MDISDTPLENILKQMLQRHLVIYKEKKILKKGKFILFKQNNFNIDMHLLIPKKNKMSVYSIPIPFISEFKDRQVAIFDYKITSLGRNNINMCENLNKINPAKKSKFYNAEIIIEMDPML